MSLFLEREYENIPIHNPDVLAERALNAVMETTNCPYEVQINILLTDEEQIRYLNHAQRQIDRVTDVLSFPMLTYSEPGLFPDESEYTDDMFDLESGELLLGDIALCIPKVLAQAEQFGHSPEREFAFLLVHSFLHLCGYDHMQEEERKIMELQQKRIMEQLGITRGD